MKFKPENIYVVDPEDISKKLQLGMFTKLAHGIATNKERYSHHWNGKEWVQVDNSKYWRPQVFEE
jgi:hypothetical protein